MQKIAFILLVFGALAVSLRPPEARTQKNFFYPEELPGPFTGGFGEESCHSCHFDYPLNYDKGSLVINDVPEAYIPGKTYTFKISIYRSGLGNAGFQISSRFEDGEQAGAFKKNSEQVRFTSTDNNIQYLQHSLKSTTVHNRDSTKWKITWVAPKTEARNVILNIAANAANGDASAFGDFIYLRSLNVEKAD